MYAWLITCVYVCYCKQLYLLLITYVHVCNASRHYNIWCSKKLYLRLEMAGDDKTAHRVVGGTYSEKTLLSSTTRHL